MGRDWLPETIYLNRYRDSTYTALAGFQEDADITTTTLTNGRIEGENLSIWREGRIPWRSGDRGYNGVFLGWNRAKDAAAASYSITLPPLIKLAAPSTLELSIAALDENAPLPGKKKEDKDPKKKKDREAVDFTIELTTTDGVTTSAPLSRYAAIPPPLKEQFTKLGPLETREYEKDWEPVFQSVRIPLSAFQSANLAKIRIKFDRTAMYVICIGSIGFGGDRN